VLKLVRSKYPVCSSMHSAVGWLRRHKKGKQYDKLIKKLRAMDTTYSFLRHLNDDCNYLAAMLADVQAATMEYEGEEDLSAVSLAVDDAKSPSDASSYKDDFSTSGHESSIREVNDKVDQLLSGVALLLPHSAPSSSPFIADDFQAFDLDSDLVDGDSQTDDSLLKPLLDKAVADAQRVLTDSFEEKMNQKHQYFDEKMAEITSAIARTERAFSSSDGCAVSPPGADQRVARLVAPRSTKAPNKSKKKT